MKRRPYWYPKPILYRLLNSFLFEGLSFVSINLLLSRQLCDEATAMLVSQTNFVQTLELFSFGSTFVCFYKFTAVTAAMRWSDIHVDIPNQFCTDCWTLFSFVSINLLLSPAAAMLSRQPCCHGSHAMKRRPCWYPKPILYRLLNSFLLEALSFASINLHGCWPREGKRSISPSV